MATSSDEAAALHISENNWFFAKFLCLVAFALLIEFFVLYAILYKSPPAMHTYKCFLALNTFWDVLITLHTGFLFEPQEQCCNVQRIEELGGQAVMGTLRGLLVSSFGRFGAHTTFAMLVFLITAFCLTQLYSLLYRYSVLLQNKRVQELIVSKAGVAAFLTTLIVLGSFFGYTAFFCVEMPSDITELVLNDNADSLSNESLAWSHWLWRVDTTIYIIDLNRVHNRRAIALALANLVLFNFASLLLIVLIVIRLKRCAVRLSRRTYKLHRQLTGLLAVQLGAPLFLMGLPIGLVLLTDLKLDLGNNFHQYWAYVTALFAPSNSFITLFFIPPYRAFVCRLIGRACCCKRFIEEQKKRILAAASSTVIPNVHDAARTNERKRRDGVGDLSHPNSPNFVV
ncbi:serpentine type 7TM GPCR chemoreceptor srd domain-containing protein [Ditylenchus destructor]|uniref:Serpentine type 7TM GPCR chemoreceptor srd domain-containing protein n=1 Tax=Ditylenchus destructor TaxID=166010 RepID=A0AAD4QW10_9BILA|nr:serpentine type 7TM GPCR chemoreceptor srd domain-containing protein [Ditylenchus destructor]